MYEKTLIFNICSNNPFLLYNINIGYVETMYYGNGVFWYDIKHMLKHSFINKGNKNMSSNMSLRLSYVGN